MRTVTREPWGIKQNFVFLISVALQQEQLTVSSGDVCVGSFSSHQLALLAQFFSLWGWMYQITPLCTR